VISMGRILPLFGRIRSWLGGGTSWPMLQLRCGRLQGTTMSALPPKADIRQRDCDVRFVPKADIVRCGEIRRYSITSSARASRVDGMVNSSALAVVRLISNSNFVGNSIGRSPGLAPLRILSTKLAIRRQLSRTFVP
jgi:hypothetical protein